MAFNSFADLPLTRLTTFLIALTYSSSFSSESSTTTSSTSVWTFKLFSDSSVRVLDVSEDESFCRTVFDPSRDVCDFIDNDRRELVEDNKLLKSKVDLIFLCLRGEA